MAKIDMKKFDKDMQRVLEEFGKQSTMQAIGEFAVERIVTRTRLGKGVDEKGGEPAPLKPLSDSYKDQRKGKIAFFKLHGQVIPYKPDGPPHLSSFTSPSKSNLTFTGQMLASIKVITAKAGYVLIGATGNRRSLTGSKVPITNSQVAGFVSEERPFLNLSKPELNGLNRFIRDLLEKIVKRNLT